MRIYKIASLSLLIVFSPCGHANKTYVETHYGDETMHGLKYINDIADAFIKDFNEKNRSEWRSLQPDPRIMVYKCVVPLKASWKSAHTKGFASPEEPNYWFIKVSCDKTVSTHEGNETWDILVATDRPDAIKPRQLSIRKPQPL